MRKSRIIFAAGILLAAFLLADLLYLNRLINNRIDSGLLQIPSRIFGRAVILTPADNIHTKFLLSNLEKAGYREVNEVRTEGEYSIEEGKVVVFPPRSGNRAQTETAPVSIIFDPITGEIERIERNGEELQEVNLGFPEIGRLTDPRRQIRAYRPIYEISPHLIRAVIAAEDRRFFSHPGIDVRAIGRALLRDIASMSFKEGGSTITQQLARNFFLSFKKSLFRKLQEAILALLLEARFPKEKILELYLNQVYLGQRGSEGIYGVEEAAKFYFGKGADSLDLGESILIAALIKSPNYYSPFRHPDRIASRMRYVAEAMREMGYITERQKENVTSRFPVLNMETRKASRWDYITDAVVESLEGRISEKDLLYGGYEIYTSLDPQIQAIVQDVLSRELKKIEKKYALSKPLQGACVVVDNKAGDTVALWGGRSYSESQFNRALKARRQVGSLFKPFVVLAGIRTGIAGEPLTLATRIPASNVAWETEKGIWKPSNFNEKKWESATVRQILEHSINTGAVSLGKEIGLDKIISTCKSLGIGDRLKPYPSLILGSFSYSPMEMAYAYSIFPSLGVKHRKRLIKTVKKGKEVVLSFPDFPVKVIKPEEAYLILYALEGAVSRGTGKRLGRIFPKNVAGKTGTTDDGRDSWFVGITRDYTVCVWIGLDDASPTPLTGATGALPVCAEILKKIYRAAPPTPFPVPDKIVFREIDEETGLLATSGCEKTLEEAFIMGTEPHGYCEKHPPTPLEETGRKLLEFLRDLF